LGCVGFGQKATETVRILDPTPPQRRHRPRLHNAAVPVPRHPPRSVQREPHAAVADPFGGIPAATTVGGRFAAPSSSTSPEPRRRHCMRSSASSIVLVHATFCIHSIVRRHRVRDVVILRANRDPAGNRNPPPLLHPLPRWRAALCHFVSV
jgi:hypothetical protein